MGNLPNPAAADKPIFHYSSGAVAMFEGRCLAIRRGREWAFPKGHIERDEGADHAAVREVREETGLEIHLLGPLGETRYEFAGRGGRRNVKRVQWFLAEVVEGTLRPEPIFDEARFLDGEEAQRLVTHQADRTIAARAFAQFRSLRRPE